MPTVTKNWCVFVIEDSQGDAKYVARGHLLRGVQPWDALYASRLKDDTPLAHFLRDFKDGPRHRVLHSGLSAIGAEEMLTAERKRLLDEGADLLGNRERGTYNHGGGLAKVVIDDKGDIFLSLTQAAKLHGIALSTANLRIKKGCWTYAT